MYYGLFLNGKVQDFTLNRMYTLRSFINKLYYNQNKITLRVQNLTTKGTTSAYVYIFEISKEYSFVEIFVNKLNFEYTNSQVKYNSFL